MYLVTIIFLHRPRSHTAAGAMRVIPRPRPLPAAFCLYFLSFRRFLFRALAYVKINVYLCGRDYTKQIQHFDDNNDQYTKYPYSINLLEYAEGCQ